MERKKLIKSFKELNEMEIFYKNVFDNRGTRYVEQNHIDQFDFVDITNHNKHLADNFPVNAFVFPDEITDSHHFFKSHSSSNITLSRHHRYTPLFQHKHTFFELIIVFQGTCHHFINDTISVMKSGTVYLIPPYVYHGLWVADDSIVITIHIRKNFFSEIWSGFSVDDNPITSIFYTSAFTKNAPSYLSFDTNNDPYIKDLIMDMYIEYHFEEKYTSQIIDSLATVMFSRLLRDHADSSALSTTHNEDSNLSLILIQYIDQHISDINLDEMAKHFNYSPQYLSKKIRMCTGYTYTDIVKQIRIHKAKIMLKNVTLSIPEIAHNLGYANPENFIRTFKHETGITPAEFRKTHSANTTNK